jgi:hypothetical protein
MGKPRSGETRLIVAAIATASACIAKGAMDALPADPGTAPAAKAGRSCDRFRHG